MKTETITTILWFVKLALFCLTCTYYEKLHLVAEFRNKQCFIDVRLRNAQINFRQQEENHIMEKYYLQLYLNLVGCWELKTNSVCK